MSCLPLRFDLTEVAKSKRDFPPISHAFIGFTPSDTLCAAASQFGPRPTVDFVGDSDPLKLDTWVETTIVAGKVVYERDQDRKLKQLLAPSSK